MTCFCIRRYWGAPAFGLHRTGNYMFASSSSFFDYILEGSEEILARHHNFTVWRNFI